MPKCPYCGKEATWIPEYQRWYCYTCQDYLPEQTPPQEAAPQAIIPKEIPKTMEQQISRQEGIQRGIASDLPSLFKAKNELITSIMNEKGYGTGTKKVLVWSAFFTFMLIMLDAPMIVIFINTYTNQLEMIPYATIIIGLLSSSVYTIAIAFAFTPIVILLWVLVSTAINHLLFKLFKASGKYVDSWKIITYSTIPLLVLAGIPIAGIIAGAIFGIRLYYNLAKELHNLKGSRVLSIIIIQAAIIVLPIIYLVFLRL